MCEDPRFGSAFHTRVLTSATRNSLFKLSIATLLLTAAILKVVSPEISAKVQVESRLPHWVLIIAVQAEILVSFLMVSAISPKLCWSMGFLLFLGFAMVSGYGTLAGYESCGCFGAFKISPLWVFALDVGIVGVLLLDRRQFLSDRQSKLGLAKLSFVATGFVLVSVFSVSVMAKHPQSFQAGVTVVANGKVVILEPAEWIGRELPIRHEIAPSDDILLRDAIVLLYHHDCPKCQLALPQFEQLANELMKKGSHRDVVLVEVPPFGGGKNSATAARYARLSPEREWLVHTPMEIQLAKGKVMLVSNELPSVSGSR